jgi:hypothetical protein
VIDSDLARAARGAALEAAGTLLRNERLADRGRLEQYRHLRRRQVKKARSAWDELSWSQRAAALLRERRDRD